MIMTIPQGTGAAPGETGNYAVAMFDVKTADGWLKEYDRQCERFQRHYGWCYTDYCYGGTLYSRDGVTIPPPGMARAHLGDAELSKVPDEWLSDSGRVKKAGDTDALLKKWAKESEIVCVYAMDHRRVTMQHVNEARGALGLPLFETEQSYLSQLTSRAYFRVTTRLTPVARAAIAEEIEAATWAVIEKHSPGAEMLKRNAGHDSLFRAESAEHADVRRRFIVQPPEPAAVPAKPVPVAAEANGHLERADAAVEAAIAAAQVAAPVAAEIRKAVRKRPQPAQVG